MRRVWQFFIQHEQGFSGIVFTARTSEWSTSTHEHTNATTSRLLNAIFLLAACRHTASTQSVHQAGSCHIVLLETALPHCARPLQTHRTDDVHHPELQHVLPESRALAGCGCHASLHDNQREMFRLPLHVPGSLHTWTSSNSAKGFTHTKQTRDPTLPWADMIVPQLP